MESPNNISLAIEDKPYQGKSEDGSHYTFGLKDIKRAKTKPYTADVFDGADLIGSVSFKVRGKTLQLKMISILVMNSKEENYGAFRKAKR